MNEQDIRAFADIVRSSSNIVFFGGAGVSTESGLKDYRSENGIYTAVQEYGAPPEEILSHDYFFARTEEFYRFYRDFFLGEARPNAAHFALYISYVACAVAKGKHCIFVRIFKL